jgi:DNA-directed RNA polymerase specialized sigma subunit
MVQDNSAPVSDESKIRTPEQQMQRNELKSVIADAIETLEEKGTNGVSLHYFDELKLKEIALEWG